jgi:hypothetical protein
MKKAIRFVPAILALGIAAACVSTGGGDWELLGRKEVSFIVERDTIEVGRAEGRFHALKLVVEGAPVEMRDIRVTFGDGSTFHPETRLNFAPNSVSRTIDLPGRGRVIRKIDFLYRKTSGIFRVATVTVYGR